MRIVVDRLPDNGKDCLFSIVADKWNDSNFIKPNCMLRMSDAYSWIHMSHSNRGSCSCLLALGEECPYLALECL
jgi:hypothetical protein